jgi:hypothetical protein
MERRLSPLASRSHISVAMASVYLVLRPISSCSPFR